MGKRLRFEVFARDGFACRYCGAQSDVAKLVVDHIVPVCAGGTNDIENLVTACVACNAGKGPKPIDQHVVTEAHRLALCQEMREQADLARQASEAAEARHQFQQQIVNYFCSSTGRDTMERKTCQVLVWAARKYGVEKLMEWIDIAVRNLGPERSDSSLGKYICGIARKINSDKQDAPPFN